MEYCGGTQWVGWCLGKLEQHPSLSAYVLAFKIVLWKEGFHSCTKTPDQLLPFKEETSIHRVLGPHPRSAAAEPVWNLALILALSTTLLSLNCSGTGRRRGTHQVPHSPTLGQGSSEVTSEPLLTVRVRAIQVHD